MISVVMPVYNREAYLAESVNSVLRQSHKDFELILVSDGSTDSSNDLIEYYVNKDKRVKSVIFEKNHGISFARNAGIAVSKGEYIAVHDSDDLSLPDRLKKSLKAIKNVDFVSAGYYMGNEHCQPTGVWMPDKKITLEHVKRNGSFPHLCIMAKRKCFLENPYREDFKVNDDAWLVWNFWKNYTYKMIQEPLAIQRGHFGNTSRTRRKEIEKTQDIMDKEYKEYESKH